MKYPSISPNGSQIVFSYKGDIYLVPSSGGNAVPLSAEDSYETMPIWSNDGKSIAYASDRYGNHDIFHHNLESGVVTRLTFHSSNDYPGTFSNDDQTILFNSLRVDLPTYAQFPNGRMPELYGVPVTGGTPRTILTTPSEEVVLDNAGEKIYYQDRKGYEDPFRKHHESSITRDIWVYDQSTKKHTQLTTYAGEDRDPVLSPDNKTLFYLSEESGSFNVHKLDLENPGSNTQVTTMENYPIRTLSISDDGTLCFDYNGEIFIKREGSAPNKVNVNIVTVRQNLERETVPISSGIVEMALSPNGKEFVFVKRGEIFVSSVEEGTTKRITNTGSQERSVSFSPDGKSILYAAERNGSWNVYETKISNGVEKYFFNSTVLEEKPLVATNAQEFQPVYSPDGKKVAYLEDRTTLKVIDLASGKSETILPAINNYA
jgi:Tol biopolymer transport system component